ncbi:LuxR C-terminal-related transcriptional regulator [Streptomyces lanatus]|uniref:Response regulator transcription factor n=1 Tax=Streptomyces lanatus TaxID=66900 RepID=A0ABV1XQ84_9ACTN|nr:response regulator transcription factor [Streptomyces lanatus]GHG88522.1 DNA-binding response regulator [Streptomyces lanatus]
MGQGKEGRVPGWRRLVPGVVVLLGYRRSWLRGDVLAGLTVAAYLVPQVMAFTTFDLDEYAYDGLRAGASGFLLKDARPEELVAGIRAVATGDAVVAPRLTRRLLDAYAHQVLAPADAPLPEDPRLRTLSDREREVLVAIAQGWTNSEIAEQLVLTESTVKKHVGRVLAKIGARDRVQAVIMAYDAGLVRAKS